MTDEEKISLLALMLGDIEGGPYYPMFTPEQYEQFLVLGKGDVNRAVVYAAISAGYFVASENTREVIDDIQISSNTGATYLKLLNHLMTVTSKAPPPNLMPWFGNSGSDNNKLLNLTVCDCSYESFVNKWNNINEHTQ